MSEDKKNVVKMAHIYSQEGRWDKAIAEYKKLIKLDPEDYNSYSMIGDVYVKKGELQPAFDAYLVCSDAYIRLGQLEKASLVQSKIARLDTAQLDADSKNKQAIFTKQVEGDKAFEAGEIEAAAKAYQAVLEMDPDRFDLYQKLGDLYLRKGDTEAACKKYLEIGDIYFRNKLIKKAAPIYLKVIELDPENVEAYAALAEIHVKSGNESEAKRELLQLTELLFMRGDYERCFQFAQKGEQLKSIESYNYLGHVELRRGKVAEAKVWFEKLLKFKLNHGGALWGMGLALRKDGNEAEAQKALEKVPNKDRFYGEAQAELGDLYAKQGKNAEAIEAFKTASTLLREKGMDDAAKQAAERAGALGAELSPAEPAKAPSEAPLAAPAPTAPTAPVAAPAPVAPLPVVPAAAPTPPPLPVKAAAPPAALPETAETPSDDAETLLGLAGNFEAEEALDEAIGLYQRVLAQDPANQRAKAALARVYGALARGAMDAAAPEAAEPARESEELQALAQKKAKAEDERLKAEEQAKRQAEDLAKAEAEAKRLAEERTKAEAEAKRQIEQKIAVEKEAQAKLEAEAKLRAETETRLRAEIAAHQKAQEEAKRQAAEATQQADDMKKRLEAEIRAQLEGEMRKKLEEEARSRADEEVALKVLEAKRQAQAEARKTAEEEIRRQFEAEKAKLENENAEVKRRLEDELRQRITLEVQKKENAETQRKVEVVRQKSEDEARKKIQADVLARVQAQQKEKMAPLQRTIEEIRRKVEEQQSAAQAAAAPSAKKAAPSPAPAAQAPGPAEEAPDNDDMDDFMTAAVADIYVKQGLVKEAQRIYERIVKREPGNGDVRAKLDALLAGKPLPEASQPKGPGDGPAKKSKVSYL